MVITDSSRRSFTFSPWFACCVTPVIGSQIVIKSESRDWFRSFDRLVRCFCKQRSARSLDPVQGLESGCSVCYRLCSAYFFLPYCINCAETSEWHKTINQLRSVTASHSLLCCCIYQLCLYYIINVCGLSDFARLPFCLCLVRAPLTVPGHSGTPVIEAELREGTDRRDQGGVDVTSPAGPWHQSGGDRK